MTTRTYRVPLLALLALIGALIAGCGDSDDTTSSSKAEGNGTDRAFVAAMVPHHESAIEMAAVAEDEATSDFVKKLAADISRTQKAEIAQMKRVDTELAGAGIAKGELAMKDHEMGMDMDAAELRGAKPFDAKFIALMTPHHVGAVEMAKVEISKGDNAELKKLAQSIITSQEKEIAQMRDHAGGSADADQMDHSG